MENDKTCFIEILKEKLSSICSRYSRKCTSFSDIDFIKNGIFRVCSSFASGRDFLQSIDEVNINSEIKKVAKSTFFGALSSERRKHLVEDYSKAFYSNSTSMKTLTNKGIF